MIMKELVIFIIIAIIIISVFTAICSSVYGIGSDTVPNDDPNGEYVNIEKELQKISWVYYLLGGLSIVGVATAAIVITRKKD